MKTTTTEPASPIQVMQETATDPTDSLRTCQRCGCALVARKIGATGVCYDTVRCDKRKRDRPGRVYGNRRIEPTSNKRPCVKCGRPRNPSQLVTGRDGSHYCKNAPDCRAAINRRATAPRPVRRLDGLPADAWHLPHTMA